MSKLIKLSPLILFILLLLNLIATSPTFALNLSPTDIQTYSANSIYFYDECEQGSTSSSGGNSGTGVTISGTTAKEKMWSGFKSLGLSDEITAGIMGNIANEGSGSPARYEQQWAQYWQNGFNTGFDWEFNPAEGYGIGLIQWSGSRRVELFKYLRQNYNDLVEKYLVHPEKYGALGYDAFIKAADSEADADALYGAELDFLYHEMQTNSYYNPVLNETTVAGAATEFSVRVEACNTGCTDRNGSEVQERIAAAEQVYKEFTGKTAFSGGGSRRSGSISADCGCNTKVGGTTASNISFNDDGWIEGGIDGYVKDSAKNSQFLKDSAAGQTFTTDMPNGKGKGPNKITLHSTEGPGDGGNSVLHYFSGFPPNFTIDVKNRKVYQHFSIYESSAAVKTHDRSAGVQIEIFGYSDKSLANSHNNSQWILSNFSDSEVQYIADLLKGISKATGIPLTSTVDWSGGSNTTHRLSASDFASYEGILGHRNVPDNDHWDPDGLWDNLKKSLGSASSTSSNSSSSTTNSSQIEDEGKNITIVGDSITNRTNQAGAFNAKLKNAYVAAKDSKRMFGDDASNKSGEAIIKNLIKNGKLTPIVVIALGTNDGALSKDKVQSLVDAINDDGTHTIVFVNNYGYGRSDGQDYSANNQVFTSIKNTNPNVIIADWASAAKAAPDKYIDSKDGLGVHPTIPDGTDLFATTIYNAITGNYINGTAYGVECPDNTKAVDGSVAKLQETVKKFAWPDYHKADYLTRKQEYIDAVNQGGYHGDDCHGGGIDCGGFVYQVITKSGWDPDYGGGTGYTVSVQTWMANSTTWENVTSTIKSNADAEPGDVILRDDHVLLFVGKIPGFNNVMASASRCHRAPMADYANDISEYVNTGYEIWRKK